MEKLRLMMVLFIITLITQGALSIDLFAQKTTTNTVMLSSTDINNQLKDKKVIALADLLSSLEQHFDATFLYKDKIVENKFVNSTKIEVGEEAGKELTEILDQLSLSFSRIDEQTYIILQKLSSEKKKEQTIESVSGTVTDATSGEPLPGVNVIVRGTTIGSSTDADGQYNINVPTLQDTLVFSFIGFQTQEVAIQGRTTIDVVLPTETVAGEELVVVGYGTQEAGSVTGSVSTVSSEEVTTATTSDFSNNLTGKLPGVKVMQVSGEPGDYDNEINIRGWGDMLVVVDGVPRPEFQKIDPNTIESVSVLKDASAAVYGVKAANGVLLIETRQGSSGDTKININTSYGRKMLTEYPKPIDNAIDNLILKNEAALVAGNPLPYPDWEKYTGEDPNYPSVDYWDLTVRESMPVNKNSVDISGGSEDVTYFMSVGNLYEVGIYKNDALKYNRYNFQSNIDAQITDNLSGSLKVGGWTDNKDGPYASSAYDFIKQVWMQPRNEPIYANNTQPYYYDGQADRNPIAVIQKDLAGYRKNRERQFRSSLSLKNEFSFIEGLELQGLFSYDFTQNRDKIFRNDYNEYSYNEQTNTYIPNGVHSPSFLRQVDDEIVRTTAQVSLNYVGSFFEDKHEVKALLLGERRDASGTDFYGQRNFEIDILDQLDAGLNDNQVASGSDKVLGKTLGLVGRLNYEFDNRYLAEFSFRYDGSSLFPQNSRWGFFPAFSLGWRVTEETFFNVGFIDNLKLRFSHGELGDDTAAEGFQYLTGYIFPSGSYQFDGETVTSGASSTGLANPNITWYTAKTTNIGLDASIWDGGLDLTMDLFQRERTGLLGARNVSIPRLFGADLPQENINSDLSRGLEVALGHSNNINDFSYGVRINFSYARSKWLERETSGLRNSYLEWRNGQNDRWKNLTWGYGIEGQFQNQEEIDTAPVQDPNGHSELFPGDIQYEDWNGDGMISSLDQKPIGRNVEPEIFYGLNLSSGWKGISLDLFMQGATNYTVEPIEQLQGPLPWGRNSLRIFKDRWRHEDPLDFSTPWVQGEYPITRDSFGYGPNKRPSTFWNQDVTYLRLKSVKLSYSIPTKWATKLNMQRLQIYFDALNVFTWKNDGVHFDPENRLGGSQFGYTYPLTKSYTLGLNITF